jgi:ABC-type Fe3+-siderophore transport system permease subunit
MIFNLFKQLSNLTGLPPIASICALVIIFSLILFGVLVSIKVRSIKKVLNSLNDRLDTINQRLGWQSEEFYNTQPHKYKLGSHINNEIAIGGRTSLETGNNANIAQKNGSEEHRINTEISTEIHELLKKIR